MIAPPVADPTAGDATVIAFVIVTVAISTGFVTIVIGWWEDGHVHRIAAAVTRAVLATRLARTVRRALARPKVGASVVDHTKEGDA